MLKSYKYRLYPTPEQRVKIDQTIDACRLVYNLGLEIRSYVWKSAQKNVTWYDLSNQVPELRREYKWIKDVNSQSLYASLKNLDSAYRRFFSGKGYPKFKKKRHGGSFSCHNSVRRIDWENRTLTIPKIKNIPIILSREFRGDIRKITISKTSTNKYFASILVLTGEAKAEKLPIKEAIGIDIGIKSFVVTSDGQSFQPNQKLKESLRRLQCLQRRASRKKKGGSNLRVAFNKVALLHEKIRNQRSDYIHKMTTALVCDNHADTFVIENLNVAGMVKNEKLARSISDASFGEFKRQMKYKCDNYGKNLIEIGRFAPSSKRCSDCGTVNESLTLNDREWTCSCGSHHDRDFNAAKNIRHFGLEKHSGRGTPGEPVESRRLRRAEKQESLPTSLKDNLKLKP